jgi:hypothetical protein
LTSKHVTQIWKILAPDGPAMTVSLLVTLWLLTVGVDTILLLTVVVAIWINVLSSGG